MTAQQAGWRGRGTGACTSCCTSSAAVDAQFFILLARFDQFARHVSHQDCGIVYHEPLNGVEDASVTDRASMLVARFADTS